MNMENSNTYKISEDLYTDHEKFKYVDIGNNYITNYKKRYKIETSSENYYYSFPSGFYDLNIDKLVNNYFITISGGLGYILSLSSMFYIKIPLDPILECITKNKRFYIFWDFTNIVLFDLSKGNIYNSPSLSFDGLKDIKINDRCIEGKLWDAPSSTWKLFQVDINTILSSSEWNCKTLD